jgi:hypothetical protein
VLPVGNPLPPFFGSSSGEGDDTVQDLVYPRLFDVPHVQPHLRPARYDVQGARVNLHAAHRPHGRLPGSANEPLELNHDLRGCEARVAAQVHRGGPSVIRATFDVEGAVDEPGDGLDHPNFFPTLFEHPALLYVHLDVALHPIQVRGAVGHPRGFATGLFSGLVEADAIRVPVAPQIFFGD